NQIGSAVAQSDRQIRRLTRDVQACRHANTLERLLLDEALADELKHGHLLVRPFNLPLAYFRQADILNVARYTLRSFCHRNSPVFYKNMMNRHRGSKISAAFSDTDFSLCGFLGFSAGLSRRQTPIKKH